MSDFTLTPEFITSTTRLTSRELRYGYEHGWIDRAGVVALAGHTTQGIFDDAQTLEDLSYLLSDQYDEVGELVERLPEVDDVQDRQVWIYLAIAWIDRNRDLYSDVFDMIESVSADFEYPDELSPMLKFMPVPAGEIPGPAGLESRLSRYLQDGSSHFLRRHQS